MVIRHNTATTTRQNNHTINGGEMDMALLGKHDISTLVKDAI